VRQHVEAHQSQNYEHNHGGHHPHYAHFGFFFLLILVCHGFLLFFSSVALALIWRSYNVLGNLIIPAYSSLTEQFATAAPTKQQDAVTLLHSKPAHPWTLEQLAREVGLSRSSFAERFMHFVGQPPMHYLTQWRMQMAAGLLSGGAARVTTIAEDVGYESEAAFSRAFKKLVGAPPATWRRQRTTAKQET